jgi:hypothetical protein
MNKERTYNYHGKLCCIAWNCRVRVIGLAQGAKKKDESNLAMHDE